MQTLHEQPNFKNSTQFNRVLHTKEFTYTILSNDFINDSRLNATEVGIFTILLSNSDNYIFNSKSFRKRTGLGEDRYYNSIKRLIELGYIEKNKIQGGINWIINEKPTSVENTTSEKVINEKSTSVENTTSEITPEQLPTEINTTSYPQPEDYNYKMNELIEEQEKTEEEVKFIQSDINSIFENFEEYINTDTEDEEGNYYISTDRIDNMIESYSYSDLVSIKNSFASFIKRNKLNWKEYRKIEDKLKWLQNYQPVNK